jgi:hypothetical protein
MAGNLTDEARQLAETIRDRAREAFRAARAQTERSDEMRARNTALNERLARRTSKREDARN